MKNSKLIKEFKRSAAAIHAAFPRKLAQLIAQVSWKREPIYVSPQAAAALKENGDLIRKSLDLARKRGRKQAAEAFVSVTGAAIVTMGSIPNPWIKNDRIISFDHELGHLTVSDAHHYTGNLAHDNFAECGADAFAVLRHIQRFGDKVDLSMLAPSRAVVLAMGSAIHYTSDTISAALATARRRDITKLSLRQTVALATRIARKHSLSTHRLKKLQKAFSPAASSLGKDFAFRPSIHRKIEKIGRQYKNDRDICTAVKLFKNFHNQ